NEKVHAFLSSRASGGRLIGIHARGTDATDDRTKPFRHQSLILDNYSKMIDALRARRPDVQIIVATDEQRVLDYFKSAYGDLVLALDTIRHVEGKTQGKGPAGYLMPAYMTVDRDIGARNGEEAVIEFLLLTRCDALIHNGSSLARTVLLAEPRLLNYNVHL